MNRQEPENGRASVRTTEEEKQEPWDRATKTLDENKSKMSSAVPHHLRICIKRSFQAIFFLFALIFSFANTVSTTKILQVVRRLLTSAISSDFDSGVDFLVRDRPRRNTFH